MDGGTCGQMDKMDEWRNPVANKTLDVDRIGTFFHAHFSTPRGKVNGVANDYDKQG